MRNFEPDEICLINVLNKPLPFRKKFKLVVSTDGYTDIMNHLGRASKDSIVIDDAGYLITNHFMKEHSAAGKGNAVFGLYNSMADSFWNLIEFVKKYIPPNKIVYFIMHEEQNDFGDVKPKTIGKLLDEKVCIEGMFTIVLRAVKSGDGHKFLTKSSGSDTVKTPMDMFEDAEIDNDLKLVDNAIREYYDLKNNENKESESRV